MSYGSECIFVKYRSCCQACSAYMANRKNINCMFVELAEVLLDKSGKQRNGKGDQAIFAPLPFRE